MDQSQSVFQHDEVTKPLTLPRQTEIRMPMLDEETDFTALFILESDVPPNMINEVLEQVHKKCHIHNIWLAETILPEGLTDEDDEATVPPIDESWQSPFVGQPVEEAFKFLSMTSIEKSLNRTFIVVWNKALYERQKWVVIYRIDENGEITSVPCAAHMCMVFIDSNTWHHWPEYLVDWREEGKPIF